MAAAIIALALEANPDLTWRDVQHIMVRTSNPANLNAPDWKLNGVGRRVSHNYGYGLMDAKAMVELARKWISVPPQQSCEVVSPYYYKVISVNSVHRFSRFSGEVKRLCHVSVLVRQVPKPASLYFAVFHKGKVGGGKCRAGALLLLTGAASNFAALYLVSSG